MVCLPNSAKMIEERRMPDAKIADGEDFQAAKPTGLNFYDSFRMLGEIF